MQEEQEERQRRSPELRSPLYYGLEYNPRGSGAQLSWLLGSSELVHAERPGRDGSAQWHWRAGHSDWQHSGALRNPSTIRSSSCQASWRSRARMLQVMSFLHEVRHHLLLRPTRKRGEGWSVWRGGRKLGAGWQKRTKCLGLRMEGHASAVAGVAGVFFFLFSSLKRGGDPRVLTATMFMLRRLFVCHLVSLPNFQTNH